MLDLMYRLPDQQQGGKYIITEDVVEGRQTSSSSSPNAAKNRHSLKSPDLESKDRKFAI